MEYLIQVSVTQEIKKLLSIAWDTVLDIVSKVIWHNFCYEILELHFNTKKTSGTTKSRYQLSIWLVWTFSKSTSTTSKNLRPGSCMVAKKIVGGTRRLRQIFWLTPYLSIYLYLYLYLYICVCTYNHLFVYVYTYVCMYACTCPYVYSCIYICVYVYRFLGVYAHLHIYICIYVYVYIYIYIYVQTQKYNRIAKQM